jgi:hypothetical protein
LGVIGSSQREREVRVVRIEVRSPQPTRGPG